uniref:G-protein coupled receptors family 1 profile domain-containing protein n=1 Tax=Biomphalaria glabrata TaxID=6526 RepID=A0A2C9L9E2_BIOGL
MNTTFSTFSQYVLDYIVSEKLYSYFEVSINLWTMLFLSCFGVATNVLNAVVFIKQGFNEGVNISLMAITCWDLVRCLTSLVHRMYGPLYPASSLFSYYWQTYTFYLDYTPIFAGYVNYALTAYVSVERCLCVSRPFTVRSILTRKFTFIMVVVISVVTFGAFFVVYFIYDIYFLYVPEFQMTLPFFYYSGFYYRTQKIIMPYYNTIGIVLPFLSFLVLCACSTITIYYLKKSSAFTSKASSASGISVREQKVSKMLLTIIAVKIGNLFPRIVCYVAQLSEPEFYALKHYHFLFMTVSRFMYVLDFINADVTFFIYLNMSTNFKSTFNHLFVRIKPRK